MVSSARRTCSIGVARVTNRVPIDARWLVYHAKRLRGEQMLRHVRVEPGAEDPEAALDHKWQRGKSDGCEQDHHPANRGVLARLRLQVAASDLLEELHVLGALASLGPRPRSVPIAHHGEPVSVAGVPLAEVALLAHLEPAEEPPEQRHRSGVVARDERRDLGDPRRPR